MQRYIFLFIALLIPLKSISQNIYSEFPTTINAKERYVFYSHGFIVEGKNPRPKHPVYGAYEFSEIKKVLFKEGGFNLIAYHRPANTEISSYVKTLVNWVNLLLKAGVRPSNITLVGFSRGSRISALASHSLNDFRINTVLMASCIGGDMQSSIPLQLAGHVLSIYEKSDVAGSCSKLASRNKKITSFKEIVISTGLSHGAFYRPMPEWVVPLKKWLKEIHH